MCGLSTGGDHADGAASTSTLSGLSGSAVKPKKAAGSSTLGSALGAGAADGTAGEDTRPYNKVCLSFLILALSQRLGSVC